MLLGGHCGARGCKPSKANGQPKPPTPFKPFQTNSANRTPASRASTPTQQSHPTQPINPTRPNPPQNTNPQTSNPPGIAGLSQGVVAASSFRTYHTPLTRQPDFTAALASARAFAASASRDLGLEIFPYSVFHVFFEQYLSPRRQAAAMVAAPALAVVAVAGAFTGSAWAAGVLLLMLASLLLQLGGAMYLAGIEVNAGGLVVGGGVAPSGVGSGFGLAGGGVRPRRANPQTPQQQAPLPT
jgi:hypothetical protein